MEIFRLLSDCYYLPDSTISEIVENLEICMANACKPAVVFIRKMRKATSGRASLDRLKVDFSRLFVGPYELMAPPYGSVYLDGERKVMGDSTHDVIKRYREAGLSTAENFKDAPDHIAAELEFMHYLIFKEIEAFTSSNMEAADDFLQKQKSFLEDHLMAWVPEFAQNITKHAEYPFYQNLARATEIYLREINRVFYSALESGSHDSEKQLEINSLQV